MRYAYSVLRFVPDAARGERVNVGIIVGSDETSEWALRLVSNQRRARSIDDPTPLLPRVWDFVDDIGRKLDDYVDAVRDEVQPAVDISEEWLLRISTASQNVLQLTSPAPIAAESLEEAFAILFAEFIVDPERRSDVRTNKHPVLAALRRAYRARGLRAGHEFAEKATVKGRRSHGAFDFVVANGAAKQLTQGFTFAGVNQEELYEKVKSWAWTVQDLRDGDGGDVRIGERLLRVPPSVEVNAIYVPPPPGASREVLDEALRAFEDVNARPTELEHVEDVAARAQSLLT